jgi:uncharacterized membrane protein
VAIILSLVSALSYGVSDFLGGIIAKRTSPWQVAVVGQTSSGVVMAVVAVAVGGSPGTADWAYGALAGLGGGVGVAFLYRGLSGGRMSVVAPLSAIGTALVPVVLGLAQGDRPSTLAVTGVLLAFPAIFLISRVADDDTGPRDGVLDGIIAGLGFGVLFAGLSQVGDGAGLYPVVGAQASSVVGVVLAAIASRQAWVPRDRAAWRAAVMGPLGATAQGSFLLATQHGLLSLVAVISSLYPAATVLLAAVFLHERVRRQQGIGLLLALVAVTLVAAA